MAIDATIVRLLLVPAVMNLFGKSAWWIPRWLDRALPHVNAESEEQAAALAPAGSRSPDRRSASSSKCRPSALRK